MFLDELRHFLELTQGETHSRCTLADGVAALRMALAVRESAAAGRAVVLNLEKAE
jgi:predicted dehydrogenase